MKACVQKQSAGCCQRTERHVPIQVSQTNVICNPNKHMNGIDIIDQMRFCFGSAHQKRG